MRLGASDKLVNMQHVKLKDSNLITQNHIEHVLKENQTQKQVNILGKEKKSLMMNINVLQFILL